MPVYGIRDGGWHHFTLSFMPHSGKSDMPRFALEASALNQAPLLLSFDNSAKFPDFKQQVSVEGDGVELLAVKAPFGDGKGLILRLLNLKAGPTTAKIIVFDKHLSKALEVLMTECEGNPLQLEKGVLTLYLSSFEVKTILLEE